jgi:hypothetical protein
MPSRPDIACFEHVLVLGLSDGGFIRLRTCAYSYLRLQGVLTFCWSHQARTVCKVSVQDTVYREGGGGQGGGRALREKMYVLLWGLRFSDERQREEGDWECIVV